MIMSDMRKIEIPGILRSMPQIEELYKITDDFVSKLQDDADAVADDVMIETSTEFGLARREKILGITANADDDIDTRRMRVKSEWTTAVINDPISRRFIIQKIRSFFDDAQASININYETMQLEISIHDKNIKKAQILCDYINKYLPVNMWYTCDDSVYLIVLYSMPVCGVKPQAAVCGESVIAKNSVESVTSEINYHIQQNEKCGNGAVSGKSVSDSIKIAKEEVKQNYKVERNEKCGFNATVAFYERRQVNANPVVTAANSEIKRLSGSTGNAVVSSIASVPKVITGLCTQVRCGLNRCRS